MEIDNNNKEAVLKSKGEYEALSTLIGHENFVLDVNFWKPNEQNSSNGNIVSAGHDKSVIIWNLDGSMKDRYLQAHTGPVSCVVVDPTTNNLVTGSWDKTAKIWHSGTCVNELKGHEQNVLCAMVSSTGDVVTGSGDGSIKVWRDGKEVKNIPAAHTAPVRSLTELPGVGFISTSNDCILKIWTQGECVHQFPAHDNLVYSCAIIGPNEIATASEDKTVRIWRDYSLVQTIEHPGCVWKVIALPNGDIATACADGSARIFTRDSSKMAHQDIIKNMDDLVQATKKKISGVDPSSLPQVGILPQTIGKEDGEVKLVANNGVPEAYSWNAAQQKWDKMGDLVDGPGVGSGFSSKVYHNGKMYDYVFDIELDAGAGDSKYKLPYNKGENAWEAAQQFIWKNHLSQYHLDQIARFIVDNSDQSQVQPSQQNLRGDPFTGHQREMGSDSNPYQQPKQHKVELSGYAKEELEHEKELEQRELQKKAKHIPASYIAFDSANYAGIMKKVAEFHKNQFPSEVNQVTQLTTILTSGDSKAIQEAHLLALDQLLSKSPSDKLFPVIDLARCVILTDAGANYYFQQYQQSKRNILSELLNVSFGSNASAVLQMLTARFLANMFKQSKLRFLAVTDSVATLEQFKQVSANSSNANLKLAFASAVHNYAVYYSTNSQPNPAKDWILSLGSQVIPQESDAEVLYRLIAGIGTLLSTHTSTLAGPAKNLNLQQVIGQKVSSPNAKIAGCAYQVYALLQ
ncbi:phospholipase A-2-activating protein [Acrasis kona]|uniref:Phospholipase A-2-activating protein n=1 Tax=Acrasis kona TaxID=1008807 RepID=A0AAW2YTD1_9EUKA